MKKKTAALLCILSIVIAFTASLKSTVLPDATEILPELANEPRQTRTLKEPFRVSANDFEYDIFPVFDYELYGLVVSKHHSDSIFDYHHKRWNDYLNIADLCVLWGSNVADERYKEMAFENTTWTCWYRPTTQQARKLFNGTALSNNHLLSDDSYVVDLIKSAEVGDQIRFSGHLAQYKQGSFSRGTSVVRDDTGNGACETIYINDFEILKEANTGWRNLSTISKILALISFLYFMFGGSPYKYR